MPKAQPTSENGETVLLKLKGQHGLTKEVQPRLQELLKGSGMDPGCWQLPVFFCDELQSRSIVPVFLSPQDLATTWVKAGRTEDSIPENLTLMDIRMLVAQMQTDSSPWALIQFVGSMESVKLAQEVQAEDGAAGAA